MNPDQFRSALAAISWTQRELSRILEMDDRTVRRWASGATPVPPDVAEWLDALARFHEAHPAPRREVGRGAMNDEQMTERQREIAQGLRDKTGALIGGLCVEDYAQGHRDYEARTPPPRLTSVSYDLGRRRAAQQAEAKTAALAKIKADQERSHAAIREMLANRPDLLAEYDARMAAIEARRR